MVRKKPEHADYYGWAAFEKWADENGVSEHKEDWELWWECWQAAYKAAVNQ